MHNAHEHTQNSSDLFKLLEFLRLHTPEMSIGIQLKCNACTFTLAIISFYSLVFFVVFFLIRR